MKNHLIAASLLILLAAASCKKDDAQHNYGTAGPYTSLDAVFKGQAPVSRTASVSVSSGGSVYAVGGTRIVIPANAFVKADGSTVTGAVQVVVNDWLKKGDMFFGNMAPIAEIGEPLLSGGMASVNVTQNGQPVFLAGGKMVQMNLPQFGNTQMGMAFFDGKPTATGTPAAAVWRQRDSSSGHGNFGVIVYNGDTISMYNDSLGLANADRYLSSPNYQSFNVTVVSPDGDLDNISAAAMYDQYKAIWPLYSAKVGTFSESHVPDIPVHLVVTGMKNGYFYAGIVPATPANGKTYTVTLSKTDPGTLKQQLNAL